MSLVDAGTDRQGGRYAIHDRIAAGGMASVHFGVLVGPSGFRRVVAIKKLHAELALDPALVTMFLDEARMASRVRHANVVSVLDVVQEGGELLLVMEYIAGETLSRLLRAAAERGAPPPPGVAVAIAAGVLHGLHAAHEARDDRGEPLDLVHRDVSPQNVLVGADGIARVVDFGIAKATGRLHTTKEGQLKGKIPYMAPEQLRAGQVSRQSDIWSASVVLWEMLTGERLFDGESEGHIYSRIVNERAPLPSKVAPSVPRELDAIVAQGLQRAPERRFATARDMALALEQCLPPATAAQVGAWVESMAHEALAERAARLLAIERRYAEGAAPLPAAPADAAPASATPAGLTRDQGVSARRAPVAMAAGVGLAVAAGVALVFSVRAPAERAPADEPAIGAASAALAPSGPEGAAVTAVDDAVTAAGGAVTAADGGASGAMTAAGGDAPGAGADAGGDARNARASRDGAGPPGSSGAVAAGSAGAVAGSAGAEKPGSAGAEKPGSAGARVEKTVAPPPQGTARAGSRSAPRQRSKAAPAASESCRTRDEHGIWHIKKECL